MPAPRPPVFSTAVIGLRCVLCLLIMLSVGGCGDDAGDPTDVLDTAGDAPDSIEDGQRVELGTTVFSDAGDTTFGELPAEDGTIKVVFGLQGGYHFEVATRLYNITAEQADGMALDYTVRLEDSTDNLGFPARPILSPRRLTCTDTYCDRVGDRTILSITDPNEVLNKRVILRVEGTLPLGGGTFSDERILTVSEVEEELGR